MDIFHEKQKTKKMKNKNTLPSRKMEGNNFKKQREDNKVKIEKKNVQIK